MDPFATQMKLLSSIIRILTSSELSLTTDYTAVLGMHNISVVNLSLVSTVTINSKETLSYTYDAVPFYSSFRVTLIV
jgi:hypothetical protein